MSHEHNLLIFHNEQKIFFHHRHKKLITEEKTLDFYVIQSLVYILYILILYVGYLHIPRLIINKYLKKYSLISYFRFKIASVIKYIARIKTKTCKGIIVVAVLFCIDTYFYPLSSKINNFARQNVRVTKISTEIIQNFIF